MKKLFTLFLALAASVGMHAAIINGTCDANQTYTISVSVAAGEKAFGKIYFENENFPDDYWFVIFERQ